MRGDGRKASNPKKTLLRLLSYLKKYTPTLVLVLVCILLASVAQAQGSRALGPLVDDYILPMVESGSTDFSPLFGYLAKLACIFGLGILGSFLYNYLMVGVTQGVQKTIRDDLFTKMQRLPLRYFDSHPAGDIMSRYTSDIDTLRQVLSQSLPQCVSSLVTLIVVLINLIDTSWILTIVMAFTVALIIYVTKVLASKSAGYFIGQQKALGAVNGYIEEMISGQKVVKIFNHEEVCKESFDKINEELRANAYNAGKFSNMLGPINNNLGYVQYAVLAIFGGLICIKSDGRLLTLGSLMAFMVLSRSFNMPITQISNQVNAIVMDMDVICKEPPRYAASGIMDGMAKMIEIQNGRSEILLDDVSIGLFTAYTIAEMAYHVYEKEAHQACHDIAEGKLTKAVEDIAYLNVAVAGIVSGVSKGFGQTALGHETYELVRTHFTQEAKPYLHGEIVAIGDCLQLAFNGHPEQVAPFRAFMRSMDMPLTLEDIGIDPNSPKMENLFQDLFHSPFMEPTAENEARLRKAMHYLSAD